EKTPTNCSTTHSPDRHALPLPPAHHGRPRQPDNPDHPTPAGGHNRPATSAAGCRARDMAAELTRAARLAVLGLTTTTDTPPLSGQAAVLAMTGGLITGRLHMYLVAPDPAMEEVPVRWWANLRVTLPWAEVAGRLAELLDQRTVVVHEPGRLD